MLSKIRNFLSLLAVTATPAIAENTSSGEEIINYLLAGETKDCVEIALKEAIADDNAKTSWS